MSIKHIITALCIGCMITPALSAKNKKSKEAEPEGYKFRQEQEEQGGRAGRIQVHNRHREPHHLD